MMLIYGFTYSSLQCAIFGLSLLVICTATKDDTSPSNHHPVAGDQKYNSTEDTLQHLELFHYSEELHVLGPTKFSKPTEIFRTDKKHEDDIFVPFLQPIHGKHRAQKDALVAFAAEYPLRNYMSFIESLRLSNYTGDVVLSISVLDVQKEDVWTYLTNADDPGDQGLRVILYATKLTCFNAEQEQVDSFKGGSRVCYGHELYATKDSKTGILTPLKDPRKPRTVQTLRYELYWIMCQSYSSYSWILVIDARDSVFQSNPFEHVPRRQGKLGKEKGGLIYMFGENVNATRLGKSKSNRKWLQAAYGDVVGTQWLSNKPTICSGATMGEWIAMETYLRAMVGESDYTGVTLAGADQGFHNYLHYSHKLKYTTETIAAIVVFDQGQGIVNNMGALRDQPLQYWGNGNILRTVTDPNNNKHFIVQNWDGTVSPVVHQFDRFKELSDYFIKNRVNEYIMIWNEKMKLLNLTNSKFSST